MELIIIIHILMLSICTWNIRGALYNRQHLDRVSDNCDILAVTEHWLTDNTRTYFDGMRDTFYSSVKVRNTQNGYRGEGGVAILVRKTNCASITTHSTEQDYITAITISRRNCVNLSVICTLLPSTNSTSSHYCECLQEVFDTYDELAANSFTVICGDFNTDILHNKSARRSQLLNDFLSERNLISCYTGGNTQGPMYTWRNKSNTQSSLIDYIFIQQDLNSSVMKTIIQNNIPFETSDHFPVTMTFMSDRFLIGDKQWSTNALKWQQANDFELKMYSTEVDKTLGTTLPTLDSVHSENVENYYDCILAALHSCAEMCIPRGEYKNYLKPYWKGSNLNYYHYQMRRAKRKWTQEGKPRDPMQETYKSYKQSKCDFRREKRKAERQWNKEKYFEITAACEMDIAEFYRTVKKQRRTTNISGKHSMIYNGETGSTPAEDCTIWGKYFQELLSPLDRPHFIHEFKIDIDKKIKEIADEAIPEEDPFFSDSITVAEVIEVINTVKVKKAPGPDLITNEHMKYAGHLLYKHLTHLMNMITSTCYIPEMMRVGTIIPIYKGNHKDRCNPANYRGITLTSAIGKVFERVLLNRITRHENLCEPHFPHALQCGFRQEHGAVVASHVLREAVTYYTDRQSNVYTACLDNEKAFDRIWHNGLLVKLHELGLRGKCWHIIRQSYHDSHACVRYKGYTSDRFRVKQGVGQGRVLSAWMFVVYINGLIQRLDDAGHGLRIGSRHIPTVLLADDTTLLSATSYGLKKSLNVVHQYARKWRLTYNPLKSCVLIFRGKYGIRLTGDEACYSLGDNRLDIKATTIYAGGILSTNKSSERTKRACANARRTISSLKDIGLKAGKLNPAVCANVWRRVIIPSALYGSELWSNMTQIEIRELEVLQRYFARIVQNFYRRSSTLVTIQTLGLWSMEGTIDKRKLTYLGQLCRAKTAYIHKKLFMFKYGQFLANDTSVSSIIHDLLKVSQKYGLYNFMEKYFTDGYFPNKLVWKRIINESIFDHEKVKWNTELDSRPDLQRFRNVHGTLAPHRLWNMCRLYNMYNKHVYSLVKLGILPITSGECLMCNDVTEDIVYHQLIICKQLVNERNKLYECLFDCMDIDSYLQIEDCNNNEIKVITLLGGITELINDMSLDEWALFLCIIAREISSWNLQAALYI